jgi:anti-repressor protein
MRALQQIVPTQQLAALVVIQHGQLVTTTLAIAAGTVNSHEAVIKLVRTHQGDFAEFGLVRFEIQSRKPGQHGGGDTEYAVLNEDQATLLIAYMRNSEIVRRFKITLVREFSNMRRGLAAPCIPNFADEIEAGEAWLEAKKEARAQAARAAHEAEKVLQLEHQVAELAPAAEALQRIASDTEHFCMTDAAKQLQMQPRKFTKMLLDKGWIYVRESKKAYVAAQPQLDAGCLTHRYGNYQDPDTGQWKKSAQVLVTGKGITKLSMMLSVRLPQEQASLQI